jgi:hypothetical protein
MGHCTVDLVSQSDTGDPVVFKRLAALSRRGKRLSNNNEAITSDVYCRMSGNYSVPSKPHRAEGHF